MGTGTRMLPSSGGIEDASRLVIRACVRRWTFLRSSAIWYRLTCRGRVFFVAGILWHVKGKAVKLAQGKVGSDLESKYFDVE